MALKSGLTLMDGLDMLCDQATGGKFQKMLEEIIETLRSGHALHEAFSHYPREFSPLYINLVKTGELSGTLEENLGHMAEELHKSQELREKIKSAMMYPLLILVAVAALGLSVAIFVLPKILPLFKALNVDLPITTRGLIWVAEIFSKYGLWIGLGTIGSVIFFRWFLKRRFLRPALHFLLLRLPLAGPILRAIQLERFSRTLATLLKSGIPLDRSLQITADAASNALYQKTIHSFILEIQKGNGLAVSMEYYPRLFPKIASRMVGMGEKTGNLEKTLDYLSTLYNEEVDHAMKNFSTMIEPVLLIFIGLIVGLVAISILGPIYKITGGISH